MKSEKYDKIYLQEKVTKNSSLTEQKTVDR